MLVEEGKSDKPDLTYGRATTEQITKAYKNNSQAWSAPLALQDYLKLSRRLAQAEGDANSAYWVLYDSNDHDTIISSCTTHLRDALVNEGKGSRPVKAVVITHIFTHPEHRMKGMATHLLERVQETIDKKKDHRVEFSVLYSGAHTELFDKLGWKPYPASQLRITTNNVQVDWPSVTRNLHYLSHKALEPFIESDVSMSNVRLSAKRDGTTHMQFVPSEPIARWHVLRSTLYSEFFGKGKPPANLHGAIHRDEGTLTAAWAWWSHDFQERKLRVGRIVTTRHSGLEAAVKEVLKSAVAEASAWGFREVILWAPTKQVITGAEMLAEELGQGVKAIVEDRAEMVPCLRWHGGEQKEVEWVERQYYSWC